MSEQGSIESNVEKGRGIVDKSPFRVVGSSDFDRQTAGSSDESRGRGRPPVDKSWNTVGKSADQEVK